MIMRSRIREGHFEEEIFKVRPGYKKGSVIR